MVLGGAGEGTGGNAEKEFVRAERVRREEDIRTKVDDESAQEKNKERINVGTLRRTEEKEWRNTPGWMKNGGMH